MTDLGRQIAQTVVEAAEELVRAGAFDDSITDVVVTTIRSAPDEGLTETGFILKMTVEVMAKSVPSLKFASAKKIAIRGYRDFLRENSVKFGDPGWDWSGAGAREIAHEYEIAYWEIAA